MTIRIGMISDTHTQHASLSVPELDILIHAGDFGLRGTKSECLDFFDWLKGLDQVNHKVVIAGNHDRYLQSGDPTQFAEDLKPYGIHYLQDNSVSLLGLKIYGTPWTPFFCNWAFQGLEERPPYGLRYPGGPQWEMPDYPRLSSVYDRIPDDTDVLVCHGPPSIAPIDELEGGERVGSSELLKKIAKLSKLKLGVFGHLHSGYGSVDFNGAMLYNVSSLDESYSNPKPVKVITLEAD
jgi:hypothetical protein